MRLMISLSNDEQKELHAAAERERRDIRDQVVLLALKALREGNGDQHRVDEQAGDRETGAR